MNKPFRILFVGNSYTIRNDMPGMLKELAAADGIEVALEPKVFAFGGASLAAHWNRGEVQRSLGEEKWDAVVLQDQSTRPIRALKSMQKHVRLLVTAINATAARPFLYMTWARKHEPDSQHLIASAYRELAQETGASLVPAGEVWREVGRLRPGLELYDADGSHPSIAGSYVSACVFLGSLLGRAPKQSSRMEGNLSQADLNCIHQVVIEAAGQDKARPLS
jgi:hypothetical protein